jgi:hypothetical protein
LADTNSHSRTFTDLWIDWLDYIQTTSMCATRSDNNYRFWINMVSLDVSCLDGIRFFNGFPYTSWV